MTGLGFLGPRGTFGEQAALAHDSRADLVPLPSNSSVVEAVADGSVAEGVVPIENSLEGSVNDSLDALLRAEGVHFLSELVLPVEHNLIASPGSSLRDIKVVSSHPQALAQCRIFIEREIPSAQIEASLSTAAAVQEAVQNPGRAAVGTRRAAELAGGDLIATGIQDEAQNQTRFLVLGGEDRPPTGDDKTSFAFTVAHDKPGTLIGVLQELSERSINLTHIESRPSRQELGIYVFFIDFQGHRSESTVAAALTAIKARAHYFRVFGSYAHFRASQI